MHIRVQFLMWELQNTEPMIICLIGNEKGIKSDAEK